MPQTCNFTSRLDYTHKLNKTPSPANRASTLTVSVRTGAAAPDCAGAGDDGSGEDDAMVGPAPMDEVGVGIPEARGFSDTLEAPG